MSTPEIAVDPMRVRHCGSCRAPIVFLRTSGLKPMPVNAETVRPGDFIYEHGRHVTHFSTCPDSDKWRRR